jgi:putative MATE family efflux protein
MVNTDKHVVRAAIFKMILPIMMSSVLEMLVGFVSMALIGNLGAVAIGAMGLSTRVRGIIWSIYKGIAIGVQVVIAQSLGAHDEERIKSAIKQTIGSVTIISALLVLTMQLYPSAWLVIFGAKDSLLNVAIDLLKVVSLGMPFLGIVIIISGALQGKGDAFTPLMINAFMNIMNVILGLLLVRGGFGIPAFGLMGAGYAMALSQALAACVGIAVLIKKGGTLEYTSLLSFFKFTKSILNAVYRTGIPSVIESLFWNLSSILLIRSIITFGDNAYASYQLGLQAESLAYMPAAGFQVAATAYIGRYLGAKQPETAKIYLREIAFWAVIISIIGGGLLVFLPGPILGIMTKDAQLIKTASVYLIFCGLAQVPQNLAGVLGGALRGAGYTKVPMYTAGIGIYGIRIPLAMLTAFVFHWPLNVIFLAIALDMTARLILNSWLYFKTDIYNRPKIV